KELLRAARHLFARKGLSGTSIRDIAQKAGLNSSLISYYFDGKEGLYRACIEEIAQSSIKMARQVLQPPANETEYRLRLQMFLDQLLLLFLADRDTGLILIREYDRQHSPAEDIFHFSYVQILNVIADYFRSAQQRGLLEAEKDPETLASLLFGCVTSQMRMDHLHEKILRRSLFQSKEKRKIENHLVDLFTFPPKNRVKVES